MRISFLFISLALMTQCVMADDSATKILEKAIEAHGGRDNLAKCVNIYMREAAILHRDGKANKAVLITSWFTRGKQRNELSVTVNGKDYTEVRIFNGDEGWLVFEKSRKLTMQELQELRKASASGHAGLLFPLLEEKKDYQVEVLPAQVIDGEKTDVLRVKGRDLDQEIYFSRKTGMTMMVQEQVLDVDLRPVVSKLYFTKHKQHAGAWIPMRRVEFLNDKKYLERDTLELKVLDKIDESLFRP